MTTEEVNIGQVVENYVEKFDRLSKIQKENGADILTIDWDDIDPDCAEIGHGAYSIVHKVTLRGLPGAVFAQKIIDTQHLKGVNEERYKRATTDVALEGKLLERLNHPNIIALRGRHKGSIQQNINNESYPYFLLLDYLPKTLDTVLNHQKKRSSAAINKITRRTKTKVFDRIEYCAVGVASAMEYLHELGVIFRDLKPQNVGFDEDGTVKLFDLGNARELAFAKEVGEELGVAGTPRYMANEVGAGKEYGLPSDVYIYSMEEYKIQVVQNHERPTLVHVRSEALKMLMGKCWDPVPEHRPTFAQVRSELERIVDEHKKSSSRGRFASFRRAGLPSRRSLSPMRSRGRSKSIGRKSASARNVTTSAAPEEALSDESSRRKSGLRYSMFSKSTLHVSSAAEEDDGSDDKSHEA